MSAENKGNGSETRVPVSSALSETSSHAGEEGPEDAAGVGAVPRAAPGGPRCSGGLAFSGLLPRMVKMPLSLPGSCRQPRPTGRARPRVPAQTESASAAAPKVSIRDLVAEGRQRYILATGVTLLNMLDAWRSHAFVFFILMF